MTGAEPKPADLIATEPTTVLPRELVRVVLADSRLYWLATVHPAGPSPYHPYEIMPATVFGISDEYGSRTTRLRF